MTPAERLAYMADQIVRNFAALGHDAAITATADHIAAFWDPRMKAQSYAMIDAGTPPFTAAAAAALNLLRYAGAPSPQTRATEFNPVDEAGAVDAG